MIPRYAPTYTYSDLLHGLGMCFRGKVDEDLRSRLAMLYRVKHIFLFDSARVALYALLKAYNRPGGVLMPAYNCIVVPEAVNHAGYFPVFADIDYDSLSMTADMLKKFISPDVTVVLATHVFGMPCNIEEILQVARRYNVIVVEDAAPALGAEFRGQLVGSFGDAAIISFQSTKVISGGAGGALLTNNDDLAHTVSCLSQNAAAPESSWLSFAKAFARKLVMSPKVYPAAQLGYRILRDEQLFEVVAPDTKVPSGFLRSCSRFSGALVLMQLDRLNWNLERRRKLARIYQDGLSQHPRLGQPDVVKDSLPAWIQFPVLADDKKAFYRHMQQQHIDLSWTFRYSCADSYGLASFPNAHKAAKTVLGLPTYPSLTDEQAYHICDAASKYCL